MTNVEDEARAFGRRLDEEGVKDAVYSRPPVETRFRKGSSGNPRGRPKGSKSAKARLELALSAPVTINEGGTPKVIEQRTALFKALVAKAIKGDTRSAALVIKLMDQFGMSVPAHDPITTIVRQTVVPARKQMPADDADAVD